MSLATSSNRLEDWEYRQIGCSPEYSIALVTLSTMPSEMTASSCITRQCEPVAVNMARLWVSHAFPFSSQVTGASRAFDNSFAQVRRLSWATIRMDSDTIPKRIHQLWVGPPLPLHIRRMMDTWKAHHPDWEYTLWGDTENLVNQDLYDRAGEISPNAPEQFQSDVARYEILYQYGGIWADADFTCQRNFDPLIQSPFAGQETRQWLNNALIGAPAGSPMLLELVSRLPASVARSQPSQGNTVKSGPQFFTPIARRHKITEYPPRYFYPYSWHELAQGGNDFPDSYAVHHWQNQRRKQGMPFVTV